VSSLRRGRGSLHLEVDVCLRCSAAGGGVGTAVYLLDAAFIYRSEKVRAGRARVGEANSGNRARGSRTRERGWLGVCLWRSVYALILNGELAGVEMMGAPIHL
jgi:hypothetical protein